MICQTIGLFLNGWQDFCLSSRTHTHQHNVRSTLCTDEQQCGGKTDGKNKRAERGRIRREKPVLKVGFKDCEITDIGM